MKGKQWLKKIVCTFAAASGIFLCANVSTHAMNFADTVSKMKTVSEELGAIQLIFPTDRRVGWLGREIWNTYFFLLEVAGARDAEGFMSLGSVNFQKTLQIIKVSEQIMKWMGLMEPHDPGVKLLFRGTHFPSVDKAVSYQSSLRKNGIGTSRMPGASGGRLYGSGVYTSINPKEAGGYAHRGGADAAAQITTFMGFGVEEVERHSSIHLISDDEDSRNVIMCTDMLSLDGVAESGQGRARYLNDYRRELLGDPTVDAYVGSNYPSCSAYSHSLSEVLPRYIKVLQGIKKGDVLEHTITSSGLGGYSASGETDSSNDDFTRHILPRVSDAMAGRHSRQSWFSPDPKQK